MSDNIYTTTGFFNDANLITEIYFSRILITESHTNITDLFLFNRKTARQYIIWINQRAVILQFHFNKLSNVIKSIRHSSPFHEPLSWRVYSLSLPPSRHLYRKQLPFPPDLPNNRGNRGNHQ